MKKIQHHDLEKWPLGMSQPSEQIKLQTHQFCTSRISVTRLIREAESSALRNSCSRMLPLRGQRGGHLHAPPSVTATFLASTRTGRVAPASCRSSPGSGICQIGCLGLKSISLNKSIFIYISMVRLFITSIKPNIFVRFRWLRSNTPKFIKHGIIAIITISYSVTSRHALICTTLTTCSPSGAHPTAEPWSFVHGRVIHDSSSKCCSSVLPLAKYWRRIAEEVFAVPNTAIGEGVTLSPWPFVGSV